MRGRSLGLAAVLVALLVGGAWWALDQREVEAVGAVRGPALPTLAARVATLDGIEVVGAGGESLLVLRKVDGQWRMPDRDDWPANQRQIGDALRLLAGVQRVEAKTADPARWARLGVEDVAAVDAKGVALILSGGGEPLRLTIGNNHPALGGSYLRVDADPQVWLVDADLAPAREPAVWLDRRLVDIPVVRIESVRIAAEKAPAFALTRVDDRFGLDGQRPETMANPDDGVATAGFTDQLALDDVAKDAGAAATHTAVFAGVDGVVLTVAAWRDERGTWARLQPALDEEKARAWFARALAAEQAAAAAADAPAETAVETPADALEGDGAAAGPRSLEDAAAEVLRRADGDTAPDADPEADADADAAPLDADARLAALRTKVADWERRFAGRQFLLPDYKAALLFKTREDYLAPALQ